MSAHAFLVAAIFTVYFGSMTALMGYMALQVRHRDREDETGEETSDLDVRDDEQGPVLMAA